MWPRRLQDLKEAKQKDDEDTAWRWLHQPQTNESQGGLHHARPSASCGCFFSRAEPRPVVSSQLRLIRGAAKECGKHIDDLAGDQARTALRWYLYNRADTI